MLYSPEYPQNVSCRGSRNFNYLVDALRLDRWHYAYGGKGVSSPIWRIGKEENERCAWKRAWR